MKYFSLLWYILLLGFSSCAQTPKNMNTALISDLYKEVKHKDKVLQYHTGIQLGGCVFELTPFRAGAFKEAGMYAEQLFIVKNYVQLISEWLLIPEPQVMLTQGSSPQQIGSYAIGV